MTAKNPTPNDLRIIAKNLFADGHLSRAEIITNAADKIDNLCDMLADCISLADTPEHMQDDEWNKRKDRIVAYLRDAR